MATDVGTNETVTVDHIEAKPFGNGLDVCPVCGKPTTIGKPQTNADRIRAMTDEELAQIIASDWCGIVCEGTPICGWQCESRILDWLKQEAGE